MIKTLDNYFLGGKLNLGNKILIALIIISMGCKNNSFRNNTSGSSSIDDKTRFVESRNAEQPDYENYFDNVVSIPQNALDELNKISLINENLFSLDDIINIKDKRQVNDDFVEFLLNHDIINGWNISKYHFIKNNNREKKITNIEDVDTLLLRQEYILNRSKDVTMFYFGEVIINENFKSIIIVISKDYYHTIHSICRREVFLVTHKSNKMQSIVQLSSYSFLEGHATYFFTVRLNENLFEYRKDARLSNSHEADESRKPLYIVYLHSKFRFTDEGYVEIIRE